MLKKINIVTIGELTFGNILRVESIYIYIYIYMYMYIVYVLQIDKRIKKSTCVSIWRKMR